MARPALSAQTLRALFHALLFSLGLHALLLLQQPLPDNPARNRQTALRARLLPPTSSTKPTAKPLSASQKTSPHENPEPSSAPEPPKPSPTPVTAVKAEASPAQWLASNPQRPGTPQPESASGRQTLVHKESPDPAPNTESEGIRQYRIALARTARLLRSEPDRTQKKETNDLTNNVRVVRLQLEFEAGGQLQACTLLESSGQNVLDARALEWMSRAARQTRLPDALTGQPFRIALTLEFDPSE